MSQERQRDLQHKYNQLFSRYRKVMWATVTSVTALAGTFVYSKYQIFRKDKIINEKENQIENQKEELHHLRNEAKELNKQLMEEFKVILKNLKQNIVNDPNVKGVSNSLKNQINHTFDQMNSALRNKVDQLKNYNYKESMEKWYMANLASSSGFKFSTLKKIEIVEAYWKHHKDNIREGYTWRKDGTYSFAGLSESGGKYRQDFQKLKAYFERKSQQESKGVDINATIQNLGDSFQGGKKVLKVKYRCWGFDIKTGLFTVPLRLIKPSEDESVETKVERIEQGKERYVECKDSEWTEVQ